MPGEDVTGAGLWSMAHLGTPMAVRVVATLRIADHIVRGLRSAPELAEEVNVNADVLDRVMRHLTNKGLLTRDEAGRYALTPRGEALRDDHPAGIRAMLDMESAVGRAELSFVQLMHSVRTGGAAFPAQFNSSFWDYLATDPALAKSFDARMSANIAMYGPAIVSGYDWGKLGHLVDVGGGDGSLLTAILTGHPTLRGTVVDMPDTAESARKTFAAAGLANRTDAVAGNYFDPLPPGAGGYLLCSVLHAENDDAVRAILRRCAEAAGAGGRVFILEKIGAGGDSTSTGMDLRMLAFYGGKERGADELAALAVDAGLELAGVHPAETFSIVELTTRTSS